MKNHLNINTERENTKNNSKLLNNSNNNNKLLCANINTTTANLMNDPLMSAANMSMETNNIYLITTNTNEISNSNLFEDTGNVSDHVRLINLNDHFDQPNQPTSQQSNFIKANASLNNRINNSSISMMDTTSAPSSHNGTNINNFFINQNLNESKKG